MSSRDQVDLDIVIVAYRSLDILRNCLSSLRDNVSSSFATRVHVVDNSSGDGTADAVSTEFPEVILYREATNGGFARGNNRALRCVSAPLVLILNPDTEVPAGVLEHLTAEMYHDASIGVLGPRLAQRDGTFDHAAKRSFPGPVDALRYFLPHRSATSHYLAPHVDEHHTGVVDAVNGAFMLIRGTALSQVGPLDERYWMYGEDLDWCKRFADAGWKVVYDGRVTAVHLKGGTAGKVRSLKLNWHFHKSMAIFYRTHQGGRSMATDLVVYLGIASRLLVTTATGTMHRLRTTATAHRLEGNL